MAEKRKSRRKQEGQDKESPTKEEYAVAKFLRFNVPVKQGKLAGITVQYFIASKAVEALMNSKWSSSKTKFGALFTNRHSCIIYLDRLLMKGLFHRVLRIEKKKEKSKKKKGRGSEKEEEAFGEDEKEKKSKKKSDKEGEKTDDTEVRKKDEKEEKKDGDQEDESLKDEEKKKKEKKIKLGMPDDQRFIDGDEVYVWIYDPVPVKTFIIGLLMVLGAIALCLFPLWPEEVRIGVYYLSLGGAGFLVVILVLFVIRLILFCTIWTCTLGKHHFWFLPNLNEDVGFIDSFRPLYKHEIYHPKQKETNNSKDGESQQKDINSEDKEGSESDHSDHEFEMVSRDDVAEKTVADEDVSEDEQEESKKDK